MQSWRAMAAFANRAGDDIFHNLGTALRVSIGVFVLAVAAVFLLFADQGGTFFSARGTVPAPPPALGLRIFTALAILLVAIYWVTVAWHRFVLLGERPGTLLPRFHGWPVLRYMLASLLVMLAIFVVMLVFGVIARVLFGSVHVQVGDYRRALMAGWGAVALNGIGSFLVVFVFLRFSPALVSRAVGEHIPLFEAAARPELTGGLSAQLAVGYAVVTFLWSVFSVNVFGGVPLLALLIDLFFAWAAFMFSISVLTRLYLEFGQVHDAARGSPGDVAPGLRDPSSTD